MRDVVIIRVGDICDLKNGFAFKSKDYVESSDTMNFRMSQIRPGGKVDLDHNPKYLPNDYTNKYSDYLLNEGDMVIAMTDMASDTKILGVPTIVKSDDKKRKLLLNQRVGKLTDLKKEVIHVPYLRFIVTSPQIYAYYKKLGKGGMQINLGKNDILNAIFPLISLPEQRAIVARIEELFSDLDKGIADLKKAQDQLKVYRQAVLKKAFEGELTKEWRDNNALEPSFNFLNEIVNERKEAEVDKKSIYHKKISHEFEFSQDTSIKTWSKGTLDKLIYIAARIGWRGLKKSEYTEEGPLFLSVHSLNHGKYVDYTEAYHISEERYIESPEIQLQEGDVLLCKDGAGIGKIGIVKDLPRSGSVNSSLLVIRGMNILSQEFIYYLFSGPKLQSIVSQRITGSATPHLFQNDIRKFELLIPPLEEQHQIVQEIESRLSVCDKVEESITESLEKAKALRQSILKKAFEGTLLLEEEITACKTAPDYEPASVLLEKIKAEKKKK